MKQSYVLKVYTVALLVAAVIVLMGGCGKSANVALGILLRS